LFCGWSLEGAGFLEECDQGLNALGCANDVGYGAERRDVVSPAILFSSFMDRLNVARIASHIFGIWHGLLYLTTISVGS